MANDPATQRRTLLGHSVADRTFLFVVCVVVGGIAGAVIGAMALHETLKLTVTDDLVEAALKGADLDDRPGRDRRGVPGRQAGGAPGRLVA